MVFYDTWPKLDPRHLLYILMLVLVLDHTWEIILAKRQQLTCLAAIAVPEELRAIVPPEIFHRARIYELHKMELFIWKHGIDLIISLLELYFGFYPFLWSLASMSLASLTTNEIWISLLFVFYLTVYITLRCLPTLLYDKCILELRYGTQHRFPCYLYCCMGVLAIVLSQIILAPLTFLIIFSVQNLGYFFFLYFWLMWALFTLFLVFFLPYLCIPCIGRQRKLSEGSPLYADVKRVCDATKFPMTRVFIIRTRSMQYSNAYFYGSCCLKRIVIFDTLLLNKGLQPNEIHPFEVGRGLTNPQVVAVVAHELGHWKYGHFYKATLIMKLHFLLTTVIFGLLFHCPQLYEAVGFASGLCPIIVGFIVVLRFAMTPYLTLANFLMLWNLRRFEYAADRFAHRLGYSLLLRSALVKIYADHMSFPVYDNWYASWHHTHPTILQRLAYQQRLDVEAVYHQ
ncbi:CAAX prenyl protease 1 homolog [Drosophila grimshawi]|uniref:CAAX prenyl protease n=1 Tax=Drosophila grimshawi TaxID=7222 RepID=B4JW12_DROGR|nr:CAAX prenyl protease 1 homolog [Drosophila grimshawi]EDV98150.1 GH22830 [Drosophila grimshawi]